MNPLVGLSVGRLFCCSVCHNFLKGSESYTSMLLSELLFKESFIFCNVSVRVLRLIYSDRAEYAPLLDCYIKDVPRQHQVLQGQITRTEHVTLLDCCTYFIESCCYIVSTLTKYCAFLDLFSIRY